MSVTDLGISIEERFPQFIKAFAPIVTSVSGKVTFVRPSQPLKALSPISVTPDGITTVVNAGQLLKINPSTLFIPAESTTLSKAAQPSNAYAPTLVTLSGTTTEIKAVFENAYSPIDIKSLPKVISESEENSDGKQKY